jgi:voltage-gated potassium channel
VTSSDRTHGSELPSGDTVVGRDGSSRYRRWEIATEWPLTSAAVLFLVAYAWPILNPTLDGRWAGLCRLVTWAAWALFVVDYGVRLALTPHRRRFVRNNLLDLVVIVLPLLRPLRLLRLVTLLSVLNRRVGGSLRGRVAVYVGGATALVLFVASLAMLDAERSSPDSSIRTFGDALWWAMTTVTTVGYGDRYPVTTTGRMIAAGLMLAGIALLGIVTASLASWLLEKVQEVEAESQAATQRDVETLVQEVRRLREELVSQRAVGAVGRPDAGD